MKLLRYDTDAKIQNLYTSNFPSSNSEINATGCVNKNVSGKHKTT